MCSCLLGGSRNAEFFRNLPSGNDETAGYTHSLLPTSSALTVVTWWVLDHLRTAGPLLFVSALGSGVLRVCVVHLGLQQLCPFYPLAAQFLMQRFHSHMCFCSHLACLLLSL